MSDIIPLFYKLIEDDFRPILHADRVLLPNEFAPEDKKLLCAIVVKPNDGDSRISNILDMN